MILMMGPSGAGKSSQTKQLEIRHPQLAGIGPGELLRQTNDPNLQRELTSGELINDQAVLTLMESAILQVPPDREVILDGFPRRMSQTGPLEDWLTSRHTSIRAVIVLKVSRATAEARLAKRARTDDIKDAIDRKWQIFDQETKPVIAHYEQMGLVHQVNGEGDILSVTMAIESALGLEN